MGKLNSQCRTTRLRIVQVLSYKKHHGGRSAPITQKINLLNQRIDAHLYKPGANSEVACTGCHGFFVSKDEAILGGDNGPDQMVGRGVFLENQNQTSS